MARSKVLLTEDVPNLGLTGEIHTVAGGFARNYLLPRGMAMIATKGAQKQAEEIKQAGIRRRAQQRSDAEAQASVINEQRLLFHVRAGDNDRLYGSITSGDIADRLEEGVGFEVDRRRIQLGAALRDLGIHEVDIQLMPEVKATFLVALVREEETWADAEARIQQIEADAQAEADQAAADEMAAEAERARITEEEAQAEADVAEANAEM